MTEEKPVSEGTEQTESTHETAPNASTNGTDDITAALSALSSAAAPVRDGGAPESTTENAPAPESAVDVDTTVASASSAGSPDAPAPAPPAPESTDSYPAPTTAPIAVNATPAAIPTAAVPPAPNAKRKKWPWILSICIVAGVVLLGGIAACSVAMLTNAFHVVQHNERYYDYDDLFNHDAQDGLLNYYYGGADATFDDLLDIFNVDEGEINSNGAYTRGAYRVGGANGIAPGLYYLEGSQDGVSNYYVFDGDDDANEVRYEIEASVEYFGNYYTELDEGDAIIFVPFNESSTMHLSQKPMDVTPPYQSGCYRVGIDIPAGTYTITCDAEAARATDSEAGAYVMDDLDFDDDSITDSVYVIKGGRQTITVRAGEYLELFAAIATPATASTKVPLQHAESEHHHVA